MLNKKGQALIEFILIMPIFFIIIMGLFDFGNILYQRYQLENKMDYIVDLYDQGNKLEMNEYTSENELMLITDSKKDYTVITLKKEININTPFVSLIIGEKYSVETSKVVYEG
jgi:TadE-like protein.